MSDSRKVSHQKTSTRQVLLSLLLFIVPAIACGFYRDYLLAALFGISGFMALYGGHRGLTRIATSLGGLALAIACTPKIAPLLEPLATEHLDLTGAANQIACAVVVGFVIWFIVPRLVHLLIDQALKAMPLLDTCNLWCGFLVGALQGLVAVVFFVGGMLILEPTETQRVFDRAPDDRIGQFVSNAVLTVAEHSKASVIGPLIEEYNPFERIEALRPIAEMQDNIEVLNESVFRNPDQVAALLSHPAVAELKSDPEIVALIEKLQNDPEIQNALDNEEQSFAVAARVLMKHPDVLALLRRRDFLDKANHLIQTSLKGQLPQATPKANGDNQPADTKAVEQTNDADAVL